jgi:RNA polymerase sigma-70 factor (ECF subfamily)
MQRWIASRSIVPVADLDDLTQEAFLRCLRYSSGLTVDYPQTYLFRIAANVANEWRERSRNSRPHDNAWLDELCIDSTEEPENAVERIFVNKYIRAAVRRLSERQQKILALHLEDNLTYIQIADRLDLTRRMVKRDLALAYSQLRLEFSAEELAG